MRISVAFLGGGDTGLAIPVLRKLAARRDSPNRAAIEAYLRASGETDDDGATRLSTWDAEIQQGKRHRDYRGRTIEGNRKPPVSARL